MKRSDPVLCIAGLVVVMSLAAIACEPGSSELGTTQQNYQEPAQTPEVEAPETQAPATSELRETDSRLEALVGRAKSSLSGRLGVPAEEISLGSVAEVEWRDSSLGCPQSGSASLTVITPGYLIMLIVEGEEYEYHTDKERVVTCDNPQAPYTSGSLADAEKRLVASAQGDLAKRLSIPEGDIEVVSVEAQEWPDAGLGCPEEGKMYAQVITLGYQIVLSAGGGEYDYRTDLNTVRLCEH